ncbi:helix-turn-helix domain-containing protein [Ruminococcaceae bacterium OttesenSCG-928-I18]|nr:helix-turn-helix domain-containing protein [Ruminococcaceae bacterium OttesenSCG-928-I18]
MNRIQELRKRAGLSQTELAKKLGVVQSTLSYWEQGKYDIDNDSLLRLAEMFDCTTDYILGRSDSPAPQPYSNEHNVTTAPAESEAQQKSPQQEAEGDRYSPLIMEILDLLAKLDGDNLDKALSYIKFLEDEK